MESNIEEVRPQKSRFFSKLIGGIMMATIISLIVRDVTEPAARPLWHSVKVMALEKIGFNKKDDPSTPSAFVQHYSAKDRQGLETFFLQASK